MDAVGEVGDHLHVVLDPDHRQFQLVLDAQDEAREVVALVAGEAGGGLVEQQQARLQRERAGQPDDLLDAEGQRTRMRVPHALQLHELDDAFDRLAMAHFLAPDRGQEQHLLQRVGGKARVTAGHDVVEHAHVREQLDVLEGAGDAELGDRARRQAGDVARRESGCGPRRDRCG